MNSITKLLFFVLLASTATNYSCKKKEGCTDITAENYDSEAEEDDGSCTFEETQNTNTGTTTNTGGGTGTGTGGGTGNVTNGSELSDNTFSEGAVNTELLNVVTSKSNGITTITVNRKGESTPAITIKINGDLPTSKKSYEVNDPYVDANSASIEIISDGKNWYANDSVVMLGRGSITIEPLSDGSTKFYFGSLTLSDSNLTLDNIRVFGANFTLKYYQALFRINNDANLEAANATTSNITCTRNGSSIDIDVSGSGGGSSGYMEMSLPSSVSTGTYDITASDVYMDMTIDFVNYREDNFTNPADFWGGRDIDVVVSGNTLSYEFVALQLLDPQGVVTWVTGAGECLID